MKINVWHLSDLNAQQRETIIKRSELNVSSVVDTVQGIIDDVKRNGDEALIRYAKQFDGADIQGGLKAADEDFDRAYGLVEPDVLDAIKHCAENVKIHHQQQMDRVEKQWLDEVKPGIFAGEKVGPIPSAGLYVPRGKGCFPSVMYMLCTPAKIAGVPKIAVCTPPTPDGGVDPASLVAADLCGVRDVYKAGGAQAIAAMAFGTETVPRVSKVNGPGNPFVACAKRLLSDYMDPGMPAGPSEAIVLADASADPWNTALDLINEAEHGPDSASVMVTDSADFADKVAANLRKAVDLLPEKRREFCETVFSNYGGILVCDTMADAIDFCNEYAVEHLLLKVENTQEVLDQLVHTGEILIGESTPIVMGNFGIGINAVLPTGQKAQTHDCTSVWSFLKRTSLSYVSPEGYRSLKGDVVTLAKYEGFDGHAAVLTERDENPFKEISLKRK